MPAIPSIATRVRTSLRLERPRWEPTFGPVVVVAAALASACLLAIKPAVIGLYHDDALYTVVAKSLSEGTGYRIVSLPSSPAQLKYPFLYPYVLSWLWTFMPVFPENVAFLKALNAVALFVALLFSYALFRRHVVTRNVDALMYLLLIGANPAIFSLATLTLSETLFLALTVAALSLEHATRPAQIVALAGIVAASYLTRTSGVALILAFAAWFLLRRSYRSLLIFVGATVAMVAPWWLWQLGHRGDPVKSVLLDYYVAYRPDSHAALAVWSNRQQAVDIVQGNLWYLAEVLDAALMLSVVPGLRPWIYALLAIGVYESLRQRLAGYHLFLATYLLIMIGWPWHPGRFMFPLVPLVLLFLFSGVKASEAWVRRLSHDRFQRTAQWLPRTPVVVITMMTAVWLTLYVYDDPRFDVRPAYTRHERHWQGFLETFAWIRDHTAPSDVLATGYDPMYYLYTGRQGVRPWLYRPSTYFYPRGRHVVDLGGVGEIRQELSRLGVRHLIIDPLDGFTEAEAAPALFDTLLGSYPIKPALVFTSSDARHKIYRLP